MSTGSIEDIRKAFTKGILFTPHAVNQMNRSDRLISRHEVIEVIVHGEIIEDYPEDVRGHSCLLMALVTTGRVIHVVCAPKEEYLTIVSAYIPSPDKWESDFKTRKLKEGSDQ
ncbi:DUF4258 domain-containing protein [Candidatus Poribacteria bacterium]|nr:DUF4258 domain-containing protein [Candidatus Poribacteria bacterium]